MKDKHKGKIGKPVLVDWIDSTSYLGWGLIPKPGCLCQSSGYLVDVSKLSITIATNKSVPTTPDDGSLCQYGQYTVIPHVAIRRVRVLK